MNSVLETFNSTHDNRAGGDIRAMWDDCDMECMKYWMYVTCRSLPVEGRGLCHATTPMGVVRKAKDALRRNITRVADEHQYSVCWDVLKRPRRRRRMRVYDIDYWLVRVSFCGGPDRISIKDLLGRSATTPR